MNFKGTSSQRKLGCFCKKASFLFYPQHNILIQSPHRTGGHSLSFALSFSQTFSFPASSADRQQWAEDACGGVTSHLLSYKILLLRRLSSLRSSLWQQGWMFPLLSSATTLSALIQRSTMSRLPTHRAEEGRSQAGHAVRTRASREGTPARRKSCAWGTWPKRSTI